jgi:hypothetical protein
MGATGKMGRERDLEALDNSENFVSLFVSSILVIFYVSTPNTYKSSCPHKDSNNAREQYYYLVSIFNRELH